MCEGTEVESNMCRPNAIQVKIKHLEYVFRPDMCL